MTFSRGLRAVGDMTRLIRATVILALVLGAVIASTGHPRASSDATTDGLTLIDRGAAAWYSPSFDAGGWDRIVNLRIGWGQAGDDFTYRTDGHWCVKPGYAFGNVLTLRNPATGAVTTCTIGDSVASGDQRVWFSRWKVEMSWRCFVDLGLDQGNRVEIWVMS